MDPWRKNIGKPRKECRMQCRKKTYIQIKRKRIFKTLVSGSDGRRRHEPVRWGRRRRGVGRTGFRGRNRQGASGADAAQDRGVPPRAGLRAAGAVGGRLRAALPVRVRRPPQPPRALPLHAHPGTPLRALACSPSKCCSAHGPVDAVCSLPKLNGAVEFFYIYI